MKEEEHGEQVVVQINHFSMYCGVEKVGGGESSSVYATGEKEGGGRGDHEKYQARAQFLWLQFSAVTAPYFLAVRYRLMYQSKSQSRIIVECHFGLPYRCNDG